MGVNTYHSIGFDTYQSLRSLHPSLQHTTTSLHLRVFIFIVLKLLEIYLCRPPPIKLFFLTLYSSFNFKESQLSPFLFESETRIPVF